MATKLSLQNPRASGALCASRAKRARARRSGAALIEFALVATIFFTMLLGLIQFGIYQSTANSLWNLSREGARFAVADAPSPSDDTIRQHIRDIAPPNINTSNGKLAITIVPANARVSGQPVTIRLDYDMNDKLFIPSIGDMLKKTYSTTSTMRVE